MIVVVGMARSGLAAARLLRRRGESVFVSDSGTPRSTRELDEQGIPWETGGHTNEKFIDADEIVLSPGVPMDIPPLLAARKKGIPIVSELELASRHLKGDVIGITGSNGKTTTTTLVGEILNAAGRTVQVGGNIGTAMCSLVDSSTEQTINVIEVSSFQLDGIRRFRPHAAVLLNITPDHLDRYAGFEAYRSSKFRIFENQTEVDLAVLNRDDARVCPPPLPLRSRRSYFSLKERVGSGAFRSDGRLYLDGQDVMAASDVSLRGEHNLENVMAAMVVAGSYGVSRDTLASAVAAFRGVEHRIEYVASIGGVDYFNDSKATNVDSAIKAVESFGGNLIVILGGRDKGAPYEPLMDAMRGKVKRLILIGEAAERIALAAAKHFAATIEPSMKDAVKSAASSGAPGDVVLLSPACASFDMFDNFEHRGRAFKEAVLELREECRRR